MRALALALGVIGCGGSTSPCEQLQAKVCAGLTETACKQRLVDLEPTLANAIASDLGWRLYAPDVTLSAAERTKACTVLLAGPAPSPSPSRATRAIADAEVAQGIVDQLQRELDALATLTTTAVERIAAAKSDADRATAKAALGALQQETAELQARLASARSELARKQRGLGAAISRECLANPLAKGCS